jgi:hypothetical protein
VLPLEDCIIAYGRKKETERGRCCGGDEARAHGEIEEQLIEAEGVHRAVQSRPANDFKSSQVRVQE